MAARGGRKMTMTGMPRLSPASIERGLWRCVLMGTPAPFEYRKAFRAYEFPDLGNPSMTNYVDVVMREILRGGFSAAKTSDTKRRLTSAQWILVRTSADARRRHPLRHLTRRDTRPGHMSERRCRRRFVVAIVNGEPSLHSCSPQVQKQAE
jgi:hypothetical protein